MTQREIHFLLTAQWNYYLIIVGKEYIYVHTKYDRCSVESVKLDLSISPEEPPFLNVFGSSC